MSHLPQMVSYHWLDALDWWEGSTTNREEAPRARTRKPDLK